jgi:hypothetical protein
MPCYCCGKKKRDPFDILARNENNTEKRRKKVGTKVPPKKKTVSSIDNLSMYTNTTTSNISKPPLEYIFASVFVPFEIEPTGN